MERVGLRVFAPSCLTLRLQPLCYDDVSHSPRNRRNLDPHLSPRPLPPPRLLELGHPRLSPFRLPPRRPLVAGIGDDHRQHHDVAHGHPRLAIAPRRPHDNQSIPTNHKLHPHAPCHCRLHLPRHRPLRRHLRLPPIARRGGRLLPRQPIPRPLRLPPLPLRLQHDRLLHPRFLRPVVPHRHRRLRPARLHLRHHHPHVALSHRHAPLVDRQALRPYDPGANFPRPLGNAPHRHIDFFPRSIHARPLHHHRRHGRRRNARRRQQRIRPLPNRGRHCRTGRHVLC